MTGKYLQRNGAISGIIASIGFLGFHHLVMTPIWFILPFAVFFGALTGYGLGLSYEQFFDNISLTNSIKLFLIYLLPLVILVVGIFIFVDPIFTLEEASNSENTGRLLQTAFAIVIPYSLVYGMVQGRIIGKDKLVPSILTNFFILTGIGHNIPLFNLVDAEGDSSVMQIQLMAFFIITVMMTIFVVSFHLLFMYGDHADKS